MKSLICRGLGVAGALVFSAFSVRADDSKNAIKGGVGIGPIRIGTNIIEVEKLFGNVSDTVNFGPGARVWFVKAESGKEEEIVVTTRRAEDGHTYNVREVAVTSSDYRTPAGNSTKSDLAALWKEFPDLTKIEEGESVDGTTLELYSSRDAGVGIIVERSHGTPASDKSKAGAPTGKCRGIIVQAAGENADFVQLGVAPKKADAD